MEPQRDHDDLHLRRWHDGHGPVHAVDERVSRDQPLQRRRRLRRNRTRPSVDTIGVRVGYQYTWKTPIRGLIGLAGNGPVWSGTGWNFARSNAMRMEPVL